MVSVAKYFLTLYNTDGHPLTSGDLPAGCATARRAGREGLPASSRRLAVGFLDHVTIGGVDLPLVVQFTLQPPALFLTLFLLPNFSLSVGFGSDDTHALFLLMIVGIISIAGLDGATSRVRATGDSR